MGRIIRIVICLSIVVVMGCELTSQGSKDGYVVVFNDRPMLTETTVYLKGQPIGTIMPQETHANGVTTLQIAIEAAYRDLMRTNAVFYISSGKLYYAALKNFGDPLPPKARILGFESKASMVWFKTKHLLKNPVTAAGRQAERLFQRSL